MQIVHSNVSAATRILSKGGVIAYPTEGVYGLGCDPFNEQAVKKLLALKERPIEKGLILIAANWQQIEALIQPLSSKQLEKIQATWPGPITWVFPASDKAPPWICGEHFSIALRITDHPIAHALCEAFDQPIVSTSANVANQPAATSMAEVQKYFADKDVFMVQGEVGLLQKPTPIRDALTGNYYR